MFFLLLVSVLFLGPFTFLVGGQLWWGEIKMVKASTRTANEQAKDGILVHTIVVRYDTLMAAVVIAGIVS